MKETFALPAPDTFLRNLIQKIQPNQKTAFFSCAIIGLLVHTFMLVNVYPNFDCMSNFYNNQNTIGLGRWFLTIACAPSSFFNLPWIIGVFSIFYLGLTAAVMVTYFKIKGTTAVVFLSGMLVSFPAIAGTFSYIYTADGYMLAMLMAALSVFFTQKYRWGFLPGALLLALCMGSYQNYLSFAVILAIIYLCFQILQPETQWNTVVVSARNYMFMGVLGLGLYYGTLRILLVVQGSQLASYQGIDSLNSFSFGKILAAFGLSLRDTAEFWALPAISGNGFARVALILCFVLAAGGIIYLIFQNKLYRQAWRIPALVLLAVAALFSMNLIFFISDGVFYHMLMREQWCLALVLPLLLGERFLRNDADKSSWYKWGAALCCFVLILNYSLVSNITYYHAQQRYERVYGFTLRLADRIEQVDGYALDTPVMLIGSLPPYLLENYNQVEDKIDGMISMTDNSLLYKDRHYREFFKHYLNFDFHSSNRREELMGLEELAQMGVWPDASCVQMIDDVIVVKISNDY